MEVDPELDVQAQAMAEKALEKLPENVRIAKLPKVKEGILKRLIAQTSSGANPAPAGASSAPNTEAAPDQASAMPPPPPLEPAMPMEPELEAAQMINYDCVESCGDEPWFGNIRLRRALRESVATGHAEQKIFVGEPAEEIKRVLGNDGQVLPAAAVFRLGGAVLGGYCEADLAYANRMLSRALHPDKNPDNPEAGFAFKRLKDSQDELKRYLIEQRTILDSLCASMGRTAAPEIRERPQEAIFAEASRLLSAILAYPGEGQVTEEAANRSAAAFVELDAFAKCQGQMLVSEWYGSPQLLLTYAAPPMRTAFDCSPKRFRAQFICLLNRILLAEAKARSDCVRSEWQQVMGMFPEMGAWQEFQNQLKQRVYLAPGETEEEPPKVRPRPKKKKVKVKKLKLSKSGPGEKDGKAADPICWQFVTSNSCKNGDRCRYLHKFPEGYNVEAAASAVIKKGEEVKKRIEKEKGKEKDKEKDKDGQKKRSKWDMTEEDVNKPEPPKYSSWGRWWRDAITAVLPASCESATPASDPEVRRLCVALWRDIADWAVEKGIEGPLRLFTAEHCGRQDPHGAIHPAGQENVQWGFVPATDLLLVVGADLVGVTCEGASADGPAGYLRESFDDAMTRLNDAFCGEPQQEEPEEEEEASESEEEEEDEEMEKPKVVAAPKEASAKIKLLLPKLIQKKDESKPTVVPKPVVGAIGARPTIIGARVPVAAGQESRFSQAGKTLVPTAARVTPAGQAKPTLLSQARSTTPIGQGGSSRPTFPPTRPVGAPATYANKAQAYRAGAREYGSGTAGTAESWGGYGSRGNQDARSRSPRSGRPDAEWDDWGPAPQDSQNRRQGAPEWDDWGPEPQDSRSSRAPEWDDWGAEAQNNRMDDIDWYGDTF